MKNISLRGFIFVDSQGKLSAQKIVDDENKRMLFESGKEPSPLITAQSTLKKRREYQIEHKKEFPTLAEQLKNFEDIKFGEYTLPKTTPEDTQKLHEKIYSHFSELWEGTLDEREQAFYNAPKCEIRGLFEAFKTQFEETFPSIVTIDPFVDDIDPTEELDAENEPDVVHMVSNGILHNLLTQIKRVDSPREMFTSLRAMMGYAEDLTKKLDSIKAKFTDSSIIMRWCSEQKLINFLRDSKKWKQQISDEKDRIQQGGNQIIACFLCVHTYQNPCTCCRFSFSRALKTFLLNDITELLGDIPFHITVSYRENHENPGFSASIAPDTEDQIIDLHKIFTEEDDDGIHAKIRTSISLHKLN